MVNKNILPYLLSTILFFCGSNVVMSQMRKVSYIPTEFHNIELQLGLIGSISNECRPYYGDFSMYCHSSKVLINVPQKIICNSSDSLIIPLCGAYSITNRRGLKYANTTTTVYIRQIGDTTWYSGKIYDASSYDPFPIVYPPNYFKQEKKRQQKIKKAQKYSEEELEQDDSASGGSFDVNVLDYIEMPFTPGTYEVYLSMSGLESNREQVEIVFSNDYNDMAVEDEKSTVSITSRNNKADAPSVHVVGFQKNSYFFTAKYWNNGIVQHLSDESGCYAWANDVFVSDDDVYIVGYEYNAAGRGIVRLWKNGVGQDITDGTKFARPHSISVSNGDVYIVGEEGWQAKLWKNGIGQELTEGNSSSDATSVYVSGDDVFVSINQRNTENTLIIKLWKNGIIQDLTDESTHASARSVYVSDNDVYVAGGGWNAQNRYIAKLWKNGVEQELDSGIGNDFSLANSVFVSDGDVYVAGYEYNAVGRCVARLWKNGKAHNHTDGISNAWALSVFVSNSDIYVSGHGYNGEGKPVAILWKNGIPEYLTDGKNKAEANSVYVK